VTVPASITAGSTVQWIEPAATDPAGDPATSASWTLNITFRTNTASEGATVTGSARSDGGWDVALSAALTTGWADGTWYWQRKITSGSDVVITGSGTTTVLPSLDYTGDPGAFDGRSQAEQDLDAVQAAIRALIARGSKAYSIGSRSYTANDLGQLMQREAQLKAIVARERAAEKAAQGLGDPSTMFVRFG
jgi:hypothetical protein